MPRGVYIRTKKESAKQGKEKENLTINIDGELARRWVKLENHLNAKYPFKLSRPQMLSVVLTKFEEEGGA